ncbi:hypothetical protein PVAP13_9NG740000 [Panicum virgatum]|uniref:Uncharacterized protein n=1 Tax=Panicum virgatum TaxID=38727 RepID=A0A8T0N389_PANVG|nr:hypothetical protein PVAP13_9NG740000 [Panicum virgatum]
MEETSAEECRRRRGERYWRQVFARRRRNEAFVRRSRAVARRWGGREAAMRRAMAALAWHPAEDAEVPLALVLDLEPPSAGVAAASASAAVGAAAAASAAAAAVLPAGAGVAAAAGASGAGLAAATAAPANAEPTGASPAWDCAAVIPNEDIVSMHDAMEFHLGGRHWLDLVPTKGTNVI